jgi:hypothetical protein
LNTTLRHVATNRRAIGQRELGDPFGLEPDGAPDSLGQDREYGAGIDEKANRDKPSASTRSTHLAWYVSQRHRRDRSTALTAAQRLRSDS